MMIKGQHLGENMLGEGGEMRRQRYAAALNHIQVGFHFQSLITSPADKHLIQDNPQRPHIALLRVEIIDVGFRCHVLWRSDVIEHLRFIWHFCHLAVSEIDQCYPLTHFWLGLEEDVVRLEIAVHDAFAADLPISFQDLAEDKHCFFLRQSIRRALEVFCKRSAFQQLSYQIDIVLLDDHVQQADYVFMSRVLNFAQVAQSCDLTAKQISGDFIIDLPEVDGFDCYSSLWCGQQKSQVYIASGSFAQQL